MIVYGSVARDEDAAGSNLDVLVVLGRHVALGKDLETALNALYPLTLKWGVSIHPLPVYEDEYEAAERPFYRTVKREGVVV